MVSPQEIEHAIQKARNQGSFLRVLLTETLRWPLPEKVETVEEISYGWTAEDLQSGDLDRHLIEGQVSQIQPLGSNPWGIFLLEFKHPEVFTSGRGMTGPLRKVLRGLVPKRRRDSHLPAWKREQLLFICTHEYVHFRFAYFKAPVGETKTAPLAAFGWGPDVPARTVCEFNLPALVWPEDEPTGDQWSTRWASAFDVEKVTKRFYEDYAAVFSQVEALIDQQNVLANPENLRMFTQTLFNRLMFLRFIERKGWLEFGGHKDYLRALHQAGSVGKQSFYRSRIRPLFFEGLALEKRPNNELFGKVPFLNGGLFEEADLDRKVKDIPDQVFAPIIANDGLFYRYNFTIEESTPLDIEVAVDPEMLGKVFEELVTGRHETGSYYTPRSVVSYMCREAVKGYLSHRTQAPSSAISALIDKHEVQGLTEAHGQQILQALDTLQALDPACGSGAYLLGLLQELVTTYRLLFSERLVKDARSLYDLKLAIISRNLHGVDIDPFATNIAMLRLWLSLAVEAEKPLPLPNLDFQIETGDSLVGPDPEERPDLLVHHLQTQATAVVMLKDKYLTAHGEDKERYRKAIKGEQNRIASELHILHGEGVIDWQVQYAEVFVKNRGFDIVVTNPPYVRQELIRDIKPKLKLLFPRVYQATADLYVYFYARAMQLLRDNGILIFIASNKFFRAGYGRKLRQYLGEQSLLQTIIDFGDFPIFEATTYPSILIAKKVAPQSNTNENGVRTYIWSGIDQLGEIGRIIELRGACIQQSEFKHNGWHLESGSIRQLLDKIKDKGERLGVLLGERIFYGVKTGFNDAFVVDSEVRNALIEEDSKSAEIIRPFLRGRDVKRWSVHSSKCFLIWTFVGVNIKRYPAIFRHLKQYQKQLAIRQDQGDHWWELRPCAYYDDFKKQKIIYPDIFQHQSFAYDPEDHLMVNTLYFMPEADPGLLGILNSQLIEFYYARISNQIRGGYRRSFTQYIKQLPIVPPTKDLRNKVAKALKVAKTGSTVELREVEEEINQIVFGLYGLSKDEIKIVKEDLAQSDKQVPKV